MRKLNLRRLFSLVGVAAVVSLVFVTAQANVTGTERADVINGGTSAAAAGDSIFALGGDDTITVNFSSDNLTVFAGAGDDSITDANGDNSLLFGEEGNDTFKLNDGGNVVEANGGHGDDSFNVTASISADSNLVDGPGQDTIVDSDGSNDYSIKLIADNEQDTVFLNGSGGGQTISLARGSGRDVIQCDGSGDTVFLNGNRKAVDTEGNNLRQAALLGGTAQSGCDTLIP